MSDNTRKTSNIIHDVADIKSDVSNNTQNIQNNTDDIGNISIPSVGDGEINLEAGDGLTLASDNQNAKANQDSNTTFKIEADLAYLNDNLNIPVGDGQINLEASDGLTLVAGSANATANQSGNTTFKVKADLEWLSGNLNIPTGGVSKIVAGENVTISPTNGTGEVTINAAGGTSTGGIGEAPNDGTQYGRKDKSWTPITHVVPGDGNITLKSTDSSVSITGQNATANQTLDTEWDLSVNIPTPATPGDGKIDLSGGTGIDITGANATANQSGNTAWSVAIDSTVALKSDIPDIPVIPPAVVPGDGNITLTEGDGITVSGADATANQTGDTAWTVKTDNDYLNKTLNFAKPGDIPVVPTELGVMTIQNITPHAGGDFDFKSSDDALVVNPTTHGLSLSIDENKLNFVKDIQSGNELTLSVSDDGNGLYTLTALGSSSGGAGNISFAGGKCIDVDSSTVDNLTTYTIDADLDCLNISLGFATDQDITNAIGNIEIPEKTSDLTNDGEDGTNKFITAADIPVVPKATLPIGDVAETVKVWAAAANYINFDTGSTNDFKMDPDANFTANGRIISKATGVTNVAFGTEDGDDGFAIIANGYPGIVSNGEQVQNYNYQELTDDETGDVSQRYQATVKARKGPTSYAELMFLSDDPQNKGLRFLSCGLDVDTVVGWPAAAGYTSEGASAILYAGYEFQSGEYSPFILGSVNNADVCFIQNSYPFMTLDASENDIVLHVPIDEVTVKNNLIVKGQIQTDTITSEDAAKDDASIELGNNFTVSSANFNVDENRLLVGTGAGENPNFTNHFLSHGTQQFVIESDVGIPQLKLKADNFWYYFSLNPTDDYLRLVSYNGTTSASYNVFTAKPDGTLEFTTGINTPSITGPLEGDASIELGTNLIVSTSGVERLRITDTDIKAADGYEPQTDDSLVTKGWVESQGIGGGFPIITDPEGVTIDANGYDKTLDIIVGDRTKIEADGYYGTLKVTAQVRDSSDNAIEWSTGTYQGGGVRDPLMTLSVCGVLGFATEYDPFTGRAPDRCLPGIEVTNFYPNYQKDSQNQDSETYVYMFWGKTNPLNANSYEQDRDPLLLIQSRTEQDFRGDDIEIPELLVGPNYRLDSSSSRRSITNKDYVDNKIANWSPPIPEPGFPLPPVGINAGTTWVSGDDVPGLYMSAAFAINGVFSIVGFERFTNAQAAANHHADYPDRNDYPQGTEGQPAYNSAVGVWRETLPEITSTSKCYWTVDGQSWAEGYCANVNPKFRAPSDKGGNWYDASPITNQYGRYCEAEGLVYTGYAYSSGGTSWQKRIRKDGPYTQVKFSQGMGVPIWFTPYWGTFANQNDPDEWDKRNYSLNLPARSPSWWIPYSQSPTSIYYKNSYIYTIVSVSLSDVEPTTLSNCFPTYEDQQRQNRGKNIHPVLYFDDMQSTDSYQPSGGFFIPKVSPDELDLARQSDSADDYFENFDWHAIDAASNPSGTVSMVINKDGNALWLDSFCTVATSVGANSGQMGTWGAGALCCTYNKVTQEYALVFPDEIRFFKYDNGNELFQKQVNLPSSSSWRQIVYTSNRYLLIDPTGGLLTSADGETWVPSSAGNGPLITSSSWTLGGTNGRFITSGGSDVAGFPAFGSTAASDTRDALWTIEQIANLPEEVSEKRYYSFSSGIDQISTTTADVNLNVPEDVPEFKTPTVRKTILTQEDANQYFAEQISTNAEIADNASSTALAAIEKATQNEGTIAGNTVAIERNTSEILRNDAILQTKTTVVTLTQDAYDALDYVDPDTLYMITAT